MNFNSVEAMFIACAEMLRPPERTSVSRAAAKYRYVNSEGAYTGPWLNSTVPYMVEPMDTFASSYYNGLIFVGPAQSAKTDGLVINTITYNIKVDPMDMMIVCPTNTAARDFSMRRIDRLNRDSAEVGKMMVPGADADNKFDKLYSNGVLLTLSWPTTTELAGKPIGRVVLTDRDRMDDDVGGDGEPFDLAKKRTTTFGSNAMTVAESSPSREVTDMKWIPRTAHEAPPCKGIIGLYNRGDRRRWYWPCPHCDAYFEGRFEMLRYSKDKELSNLDRAENVHMECPKCKLAIMPDDRFEMNLWGIWLKDGEALDKAGRRFGTSIRSKIASFWLRGVAAAFVTWKELIVMYLDACDDFERTQSEEALKKFYNNDLGEPYYPKSLLEIRLPEDLKMRADRVPDELIRHVPEGVRFLVGTVDIGKDNFVCEVHGIMPGAPYDTTLIDRFKITKSKRLDEEGDPLQVKPNTYLEDWDLLIEAIIQKEYPLADLSGRMMSLKITGFDIGGKEGTTTMAYNFYRRLREQGLHIRVTPLRGDSSTTHEKAIGQPRVRISYPDASKRDSKSGARGDVPVLMLNPNMLKDDLDGRLDCIEPGKGMYRTPSWLPTWFYGELCAEVRTEKGWMHPGNVRNEAFDLAYYCLGICASQYIRIDHINWSNPPAWADVWDKNDFVRLPTEEKPFGNTVKSADDFAKFGKSLA